MPSEHRLPGSAATMLGLPTGAEIFCATGTLSLSALPRCADAALVPQRLAIAAGQGWRAGCDTLVTLEALAPSRYTLTLPRAPYGSGNKNASDWNRLASWMRRQWLLWTGHASAR